MCHAQRLPHLIFGFIDSCTFLFHLPIFTNPISREVSALVRRKKLFLPLSPQFQCTSNINWLERVCRNPNGEIITLFSVSDVLVQVAVRASSVAILCSIGDPFPHLLRFLIPCAVRAAQVPMFALAIVYSLPC